MIVYGFVPSPNAGMLPVKYTARNNVSPLNTANVPAVKDLDFGIRYTIMVTQTKAPIARPTKRLRFRPARATPVSIQRAPNSAPNGNDGIISLQLLGDGPSAKYSAQTMKDTQTGRLNLPRNSANGNEMTHTMDIAQGNGILCTTFFEVVFWLMSSSSFSKLTSPVNAI